MNADLLLTAAIAGGGSFLVLGGMLVASALGFDGFHDDQGAVRAPAPQRAAEAPAKPVHAVATRLDLPEAA